MNEHLQRLLDLLAGKDGATRPEDWATWFKDLADAELTAMYDAACDAFDQLKTSAAGSDEGKAQLQTIHDAADLIRAETGTRGQAIAARQADIDKMASAMVRPKTEDGASAADPVTDTPATDGDAQTPPADTPAATDAAVTETAPETAQVAEPVLADATPARARVSLSAIKARQPQDTQPPAKGANAQGIRTVIVAGADIPDMAPGTIIEDVPGLVKAWNGTFSRFPVGVAGVGRITRTVAVLRREFPPALIASGDKETDWQVSDLAADETRLPGGSLLTAVLAGAGWCAPSDTDFTLPRPLEGDDGMWSGPTFAVAHGGIRTVNPMSWQELYALVPEQILCEPDLINDEPKTFVTAPCPTWSEQRLCAAPFGIISDIPMETGFPQVVEQFAERALIARRRRLNAYTLARIAAGATPMAGIDRTSAMHSFYDSLSLALEWYRDLHRTRDGFTFEMLAPRWARALLKADMRKRSAVGADVVSNADVVAHIADIGGAAQWMLDWQPLAVAAGTPPVFTPPTDWPSSVDIVLYPAGGIRKGVQQMVKLSAIYDSVLLAENKYLKSFFEDAFLIHQQYQSIRLTIPLCINGADGPRIDWCNP